MQRKSVDEFQEGGIFISGGGIYIAKTEKKQPVRSFILTRVLHQSVYWCATECVLYTAICSDHESLNYFISPVG